MNARIQERTLLLYNRADSRHIGTKVAEKIPPFQLYKKIAPKFPDMTTCKHPDINKPIYDKCLKEMHIWFLVQILSSGRQKQLIKAFGGFISAKRSSLARKSTINYFTPIDQLFTDFVVVKELLKRSEKATDAVGQQYILKTFDLGGYMKTLPIIWKNSEDYKRHVVTPGPFHKTMNYLGMIAGHKYNGSGYSELLVETKLATNGCLASILGGKAYAKAIFAFKTVKPYSAYWWKKFIEEVNVEEHNTDSPINLVQDYDREKLDLITEDDSANAFLQKYLNYEEKFRKGHLGKTATFWLSVIDHSRLIMMLQYSV